MLLYILIYMLGQKLGMPDMFYIIFWVSAFFKLVGSIAESVANSARQQLNEEELKRLLKGIGGK